VKSLDARLSAVARRVPPGHVVADIGTDHALLPIHLLSAGIARRAIGTDVSPGALTAARRNRARYGFPVDLRLGYGLEPLAPGEADILVLAGMGGQTVAEVLGEGLVVVSALELMVVQPQKDLAQFRRWAGETGFACLAEDIIQDNRRLYNVLVLAPQVEMRPVPWDPSDTGAEHEVTAELLLNPSDILASYLRRRRRVRLEVAHSLQRVQPEQARFHRQVAAAIGRAIRSVGGTAESK